MLHTEGSLFDVPHVGAALTFEKGCLAFVGSSYLHACMHAARTQGLSHRDLSVTNTRASALTSSTLAQAQEQGASHGTRGRLPV